MRTIFPFVDYVGENERAYGCGKKQEILFFENITKRLS